LIAGDDAKKGSVLETGNIFDMFVACILRRKRLNACWSYQLVSINKRSIRTSCLVHVKLCCTNNKHKHMSFGISLLLYTASSISFIKWITGLSVMNIPPRCFLSFLIELMYLLKVLFERLWFLSVRTCTRGVVLCPLILCQHYLTFTDVVQVFACKLFA